MGLAVLLHNIHMLGMASPVLEAVSCTYLRCSSLLWVSDEQEVGDFLLTVIRWGIVAMCSGLVHSMAGLIACRVLLAAFEAGFGAGVPYYLSLAYRRRELGLRLSILLGSSPIANCFASATAYGITQIKSALEAWRLIFLIGQ